MKLRLPSFHLFSRKSAYQPTRRNASRIKSLNLVKCFRSDDLSQDLVANFINLSETGLQMMSPRQIKPGSLLQMMINFGEKGRQIPVTGRVAWQGQFRGQDGVYRIGIAFLTMPAEDREFIRSFVKDFFLDSSFA